MSAVLTTTLSLAACRTDNSDIAVKVVCPQVRAYDRATQERALVQYRALQQGSAIRLMLGDYKQLRDQIRRCNDAR